MRCNHNVSVNVNVQNQAVPTALVLRGISVAATIRTSTKRSYWERLCGKRLFRRDRGLRGLSCPGGTPLPATTDHDRHAMSTRLAARSASMPGMRSMRGVDLPAPAWAAMVISRALSS